MVLVESNYSGPLKCYTCRLLLPYGALQVVKITSMYGYRVYHLACWKPDKAVPYELANFTFGDAEAREKKGEVEAWVHSWNKQFGPVEEAMVPPLYLNQAVSTTYSPLRRLLLEVGVYLTTGEMETRVALVCKAWLHVTRDEELWKTRFISEFRPLETDAQGNYRRKYIAHVLGSCWHCNTIKPAADIQFRCRLFKRPLCKQCAKQPLCYITSFHNYMHSHWISKSVLDSLAIPSFLHRRNAKSTYMLVYQSKVKPYAESRRRLLLRTIDANYPGRLLPEVRAIMEAFDLGKIYGEVSGWTISLLEMALVKFCGKGGKQEDLHRNIEEFFELLKVGSIAAN